MVIKALIFDVGGVLIEPNERDIAMHIAARLGVGRKKVLSSTQGKMEDRILTGAISASTFWRRVCRRVGARYDPTITRTWLREYRAPLKPGMRKLVLSLAKRYVVAAITDVSRERERYHERRHLYAPFRFVTYSCAVGVRKPHKKIYLLTLRRLRVPPKECLFIDDKPENVRGARSVQMHAIRFRNIRQLRRDLKKYGVVL